MKSCKQLAVLSLALLLLLCQGCGTGEGIPTDNAGLAYMNRLLRAAGFHVVEV